MAFMDIIGNIQHLQELMAENAANKAVELAYTSAAPLMSGANKNAHDIIDSLIAANDMSSPSGSARDLGNTLLGHLLQGSTPVPVEEGITGGDFENGVSEETHLQVLDQHDTMLEYLAYKDKYPEDVNKYHDWALESHENREKLLEILRLPSSVSRGKRRYSTGVMEDAGSVRDEGRRLDHWMVDYDLIYPRTSLANP